MSHQAGRRCAGLWRSIIHGFAWGPLGRIGPGAGLDTEGNMALLEDLVTSGRIVDLMLAFIVLEIVALMLIRRYTGGGIATWPLLTNIGAGTSLMLALRADLTGEQAADAEMPIRIGVRRLAVAEVAEGGDPAGGADAGARLQAEALPDLLRADQHRRRTVGDGRAVEDPQRIGDQHAVGHGVHR